MKPAETSPTCEMCCRRTEYCDSVPDGEGGYRLQPLCWLHAKERKLIATSQLQCILVADGVGHVDRDRAGGDVLCPDCGQKYYDHPQFDGEGGTLRFLNILCDGSLVKL